MSDTKIQQNNKEPTACPPVDFDVIFTSRLGDDAILVTSPNTLPCDRLSLALSSYDSQNQKYSAYLSEGVMPAKSLSIEEIDDLTTNTQNDLSKVLKINAYNRKLINKNDIVGKTVESIDTNINTEIRLTYNRVDDGRNKKKKLADCKTLLNNVNDSIKIKRITRNAITTAYIEGNWISYLRHDDKNNYVVDIYPLGICEITDYNINGNPEVLFDITQLRTRLSKTYKKNKKNQALFFDSMDEEVSANYPKEIYEAFKGKEKYAKLDSRYTGVIRINNLNRRYGVSPIARSYTDLNMLDTFADTDRVNSKAKGKKIIHQKMRVECMGQDYSKDFFPEMAYAHTNFMDAWKQPTVVVTSPPTVEQIAYIEPSVEMTSKDTYNIYRSKVLSTLGIQFLMDSGSQSVSTASISVTQLMRTINSISEQLQDVLKKWYRQILIDNSYPVENTPDVEVIDSEQLETDIKISLATFLCTTLNASMETCYEIVGLDVKDEAEKRLSEKDLGYEEIFKPRLTAYTNSGESGDNQNGRPPNSKNRAKQTYDKTRQEGLQ